MEKAPYFRFLGFLGSQQIAIKFVTNQILCESNMSFQLYVGML